MDDLGATERLLMIKQRPTTSDRRPIAAPTASGRQDIAGVTESGSEIRQTRAARTSGGRRRARVGPTRPDAGFYGVLLLTVGHRRSSRLARR